MKQKTTGIILSGGKSSRMGSEKGLLKLHGKSLIQYSIDALKEFCDEILICANKASALFSPTTLDDLSEDKEKSL